jgi:nicotinamide-nucleotide amidase
MGQAPRAVRGAPTAMLLSIGSELLRGEIVDTNAAELAAELAELGLELRSTRELPDETGAIASAFDEARGSVDVVVASGGLGPTHDDLTRDGLAHALGEPLTSDPALVERLTRRFGGADRMPESNLRQALVIASASVLENPIGSAPGWWVDRDGVIAVLMPGVPSEMRRMWHEQVVPRLRERFALQPLHVRTVKVFGLGESAVAARVRDLLEHPGDGVVAGIYAKDDGVHLRFTTRGDAAALDALVSQARELLGADAYGTDGVSLPALALAALGRAGVLTLATVESGTEGALLSILAGHASGSARGEARWLGGVLESWDGRPPPGLAAQAVLSVRLRGPDGTGRSRVDMRLDGSLVSMSERQLRIHGSGPQRARRAAYAALDAVRRELLTSDR